VIDADADALEELWRAHDFIQNRLDGVAEFVIDWMPPEDNARHHNAVEMLQRAFEVSRRVQRRLGELLELRDPRVMPGTGGGRWDSILAGDLTQYGAYDLRGEDEGR
jgi:hypothetical protein